MKILIQDYFLCLPKENLVNTGGLIQECFLTNSTIFIKKNVEENQNFNPRIDSLGLSDPIKNILCVPVCDSDNEVKAVICLVNSPTSFQIEDIVLTQFFSLIIRELITSKNVSDDRTSVLLKENRKNKILQQWFKQVYIVANNTKYKFQLSKSIFQSLAIDLKLDTLISSGLEVIQALTNSEETYCIYKKNEEMVIRYTTNKEECYCEELSESNLEYFSKSQPTVYSKTKDKENTLIFPYVKGNHGLVIVSHNKRDDTLAYYCPYTRADEVVIGELAKVIFNSIDQQNKKTMNDLRLAIRSYAGSINTVSLINTIRTAAQQLLECERATVFIKENEMLVVKAQGIEHEIPVEIKVPIGKGIVGFVAQTGQTENIEDVYKDPRFNSEIDTLTGYKTKNMLCMPVISSCGEVIAALQMINKRSGNFDKSDEEYLEIFGDMVSSVLQN